MSYGRKEEAYGQTAEGLAVAVRYLRTPPAAIAPHKVSLLARAIARAVNVGSVKVGLVQMVEHRIRLG